MSFFAEEDRQSPLLLQSGSTDRRDPRLLVDLGCCLCFRRRCFHFGDFKVDRLKLGVQSVDLLIELVRTSRAASGVCRFQSWRSGLLQRVRQKTGSISALGAWLLKLRFRLLRMSLVAGQNSPCRNGLLGHRLLRGAPADGLVDWASFGRFEFSRARWG